MDRATSETPLFGEEKPISKWVTWIIAGIVAFVVAFSTIVGVVFGVINAVPQHFMLTCVLLCMTMILAVQYWWYRQGDLDPKFRFLLLGMVVVVILCAITLNAYAWPDPKKCDDMPHCVGGQVWETKTRRCIFPRILDCLSLHPPECAKVFSFTNVVCLNCTQPVDFSETRARLP